MRWFPWWLVVLGCSCSRPPGPSHPVEPGADAGTSETVEPEDAGTPEAAEPADVEPEVEPPLPPEVAGDDAHPVRIFFDDDKSEVKEIAWPLLDAVVERLRLRPDEMVRLVGHADAGERPGHAIELSRERAEAVRRYLEERGADTRRFLIDARGDFEPAASEETEDGRAANRRVDFVFERGMFR